MLPASRGRGPQTTWHQASPQGVWVSSRIFSIGDGRRQTVTGCKYLGCFREGGPGCCRSLAFSKGRLRLPAFSGRAWNLLVLLSTWDFLCLRSQRELSLKHGHRACRHWRTPEQCPWLRLAVGFPGGLGGTPRSFTGSFFLPQFPRGRLLSSTPGGWGGNGGGSVC